MATVCYSLDFVAINYFHFMKGNMYYGQVFSTVPKLIHPQCCITNVQGKQMSFQSSTLSTFFNIAIGATVKYNI